MTGHWSSWGSPRLSVVAGRRQIRALASLDQRGSKRSAAAFRSLHISGQAVEPIEVEEVMAYDRAAELPAAGFGNYLNEGYLHIKHVRAPPSPIRREACGDRIAA